jgi:SAM-dependent methyltransferase
MNIFKITNKRIRFRKALRARGVLGVMVAAVRFTFQPKAVTLSVCRDLVADRSGLEIGGPSFGFGSKGFLPLYPAISKLDNCNFGYKTVWEGSLSEGFNFQFDPNKPKGRQYVAEATDLNSIPDKTYDFVISCHALEHTANPLRALKEWVRILKDDGGAVLVLPHKEETFDHRRPVTTLQHLIEDLQNNTPEDDRTHLQEVLELTDLDRDWGLLDPNDFKQRCEKNFENRCIHQHVFVTSLVVQMFDYLGMQVLSAESLRPLHIIVSARKLPLGQIPKNEPFLNANAPWRKNSPFKIDRK